MLTNPNLQICVLNLLSGTTLQFLGICNYQGSPRCHPGIEQDNWAQPLLIPTFRSQLVTHLVILTIPNLETCVFNLASGTICPLSGMPWCCLCPRNHPLNHEDDYTQQFPFALPTCDPFCDFDRPKPVDIFNLCLQPCKWHHSPVLKHLTPLMQSTISPVQWRRQLRPTILDSDL